MSENASSTLTLSSPEEVAGRHLAHHFDTPQQQFDSGKLGMWLFLGTEFLLFSGLFCAYAVYRMLHPQIFIYASRYLDPVSGALCTLVLVTSGFTMAWAIRCAQLGKRTGLIIALLLTIAGGFGFLAIHGYEYFEEYQQHLMWGTNYHPAVNAPRPQVVVSKSKAVGGSWSQLHQLGKQGYLVAHSNIAPAAIGPAGRALAQSSVVSRTAVAGQPNNVQIFFGIYFLMTGLHSIHVIVGIILLTYLLVRALRNEFGPGYYAPVDFIGLYWGVVDMIWMFLFPLLYLIR